MGEEGENGKCAVHGVRASGHLRIDASVDPTPRGGEILTEEQPRTADLRTTALLTDGQQDQRREQRVFDRSRNSQE